MSAPRILLVVGGGIAAYKSCELVRTIRKAGGEVTCVLTEGGSHFVTPMALAALSEKPVYTTLWDLKNEVEMGHIQLSRQADLVVVCPATADLLAKMAAGIADDLATTMLLATDKPVMAVPAMNVRMWQHAATMRNVQTLRDAGVDIMEPDEGAMACGEYGPGRLPEPIAVWQRIAWALGLDPVEIAPVPGSVPVPAVPELEPEQVHKQPVFDDEPEPIEPEGLSGLSQSMISRGLQKAKQAISFMGLDHPSEDKQVADVPPPVPVPDAAPDPSAVLLSRKGAARSAPPTDPQALNHIVSGQPDAPPPQPMPGEPASAFPVDPAAPLPAEADALAGQPDFEDEPAHRPLFGRHVLITAGPTWEPIDPVRYIANRSSGKQGFAIAAAAAAAGARVTLVAGPVHLDTPTGVDRIDVESAVEMAEAVKRSLPADIAVMVAAVADWRVASVAQEKIKKRGSAPPALLLTENPDILATVAARPDRPTLLVGFAAETEDVIRYAQEKRKRKGVDWIIANDVSGDVMGGDANAVHIVTGQDVVSLPEMPKDEVARILVERFADALVR
jgi:phosphopantothenoylcysteine decarboxylase / phosphopantothenate---cysteine ligase